ncbi:hypothetical protein [Paraliomyxa miuraensis]|uniref:hypothetical protein n=1 Tax=Paraliomyxa miuraensis TaxID=376150 RepID=UPI00225860DA|nr:hypothetical protein [Paraliomyxa miuraensis]MCX4247668.1 hypothetical protein [Paraliomyxa miuraensis]
MSAIRSPSHRHRSSIAALGVAAAITIVPVSALASMGVEPVEDSAAATEPAAAVASEPAAAAALEPIPVTPATMPEHEVMIADGTQLLADGKPIESAEKLSTAYVIMPLPQRVGSRGRYVVSLACNAYEAAWQSTRDGAHLEANQVLLSAYFADLESARAAGTATVPADAQEQALRERRAGIDEVLAELAGSSTKDTATTTTTDDPGEIESRVEVTFPPPDPRLRRNALILVGAGAAGVVAGGIMVIAGARAAAQAEEARRTMAVSEAGEARSTKVAGTIVATTGALLASGAVMVLGMGSNRLRRQRENIAVRVQPTIGGLALHGRF